MVGPDGPRGTSKKKRQLGLELIASPRLLAKYDERNESERTTSSAGGRRAGGVTFKEENGRDCESSIQLLPSDDGVELVPSKMLRNADQVKKARGATSKVEKRKQRDQQPKRQQTMEALAKKMEAQVAAYRSSKSPSTARIVPLEDEDEVEVGERSKGLPFGEGGTVDEQCVLERGDDDGRGDDSSSSSLKENDDESDSSDSASTALAPDLDEGDKGYDYLEEGKEFSIDMMMMHKTLPEPEISDANEGCCLGTLGNEGAHHRASTDNYCETPLAETSLWLGLVDMFCAVPDRIHDGDGGSSILTCTTDATGFSMDTTGDYRDDEMIDREASAPFTGPFVEI